ncbi:MAG: DUF523 domain-containing protein [Candidatus Cloacimonetes bacterium]|nr:DUF523 domain-containing protein [Candidatus Cloacimonadota bacterium]MBS3766727.1 DUF523 domain-containing protein [Candidatus Cloacimonadota bacterium]
MKEIVLISGCLFGLNCRYDGDNNRLDNLNELSKKYILVPVCPEQMGGLSTPRSPSFFIKGDGEDTIKGKNNLINEDNKNVSSYFRKGAYGVLNVCRKLQIKRAILKGSSPSCGTNNVFLGEKLTKGRGVTSFLLLTNDITVLSEKTLRKNGD